MQFVLLATLVYIAAVLESALASGAGPDWLLIVALGWVYARPGWRGCLVAAAIGLVADLNSAGRPGPMIAVFTALAFVLDSVRSQIGLQQPVVQAVVALPCAMLVACCAGLGPLVSAGVSEHAATMIDHVWQVGWQTATVGAVVFFMQSLLAGYRRRARLAAI